MKEIRKQIFDVYIALERHQKAKMKYKIIYIRFLHRFRSYLQIPKTIRKSLICFIFCESFLITRCQQHNE